MDLERKLGVGPHLRTCFGCATRRGRITAAATRLYARYVTAAVALLKRTDTEETDRRQESTGHFLIGLYLGDNSMAAIGPAATPSSYLSPHHSPPRSVEPTNFHDDDGVGIHDVRRNPPVDTGQQETLVDRPKKHHDDTWKRWVPTPKLTAAEREVARRFRTARDAGLV